MKKLILILLLTLCVLVFAVACDDPVDTNSDSSVNTDSQVDSGSDKDTDTDIDTDTDTDTDERNDGEDQNDILGPGWTPPQN